MLRIFLFLIYGVFLLSCSSVYLKIPIREVYITPNDDLMKNVEIAYLNINDRLKFHLVSKYFNKITELTANWQSSEQNVGIIYSDGMFLALNKGVTEIIVRIDKYEKKYKLVVLGATCSLPPTSQPPIYESPLPSVSPIIPTPSPSSLVPGSTGTSTSTDSIPATCGITKIYIIPDNITLVTDTSNILRAFVKDCKGNDVTGVNLSWSSKNSSIAVVNNNGEVKALGAGETVIEAINGEIYGQCKVTVIFSSTSTPSYTDVVFTVN